MKIKLLITAVTGFVLGALAACGWWWHAQTQWLIHPKEVELASRAAIDAEVLAHLRLNEPAVVLRELEEDMDGMVCTMAQWDGVATPKDAIRQARDRWLLSVKTYHESYPATGDGAILVNSLLATFPGRASRGTCKNGICRLDNLRRDRANGNTHTVTK